MLEHVREICMQRAAMLLPTRAFGLQRQHDVRRAGANRPRAGARASRFSIRTFEISRRKVAAPRWPLCAARARLRWTRTGAEACVRPDLVRLPCDGGCRRDEESLVSRPAAEEKLSEERARHRPPNAS